ncbi:MAG: AAA family ATPase [Pseudomonadota bacterium]
MATIFVFNGTSSSGKSTLARQLQREFPDPIWHVSIDHLRDSGVLPMDRFQSGDLSWSKHRAQIFDGFHRSIAAYADAGNHLIIEHIFDTEGWITQLKTLLAAHEVIFIGVHCPLAVLEDRERARGDRVIGSAAEDFHKVHVGREYDLEVSSEAPLDQTVQQILQLWQSGQRSSEFNAR